METFAAVLTAFLFWAFVAHVTIGNRLATRETAGELLLKTTSMSRSDMLAHISLGILAAIMLVNFAYIYIESVQSGYHMPSWLIFISAFVAFEIGWITIMRVVILQTEFHRHGIVTPSRGGPFSFLPWSHILYCKRLAPGRKLLIQAKDFNFQIKIDPKRIEQINAVLVQRVDTRDANGETINAERIPFEFPHEPRAIKRRLLQFNIKTALLFMVVASSAFAWLGIHLRAGWREQEALTRLEEFGVKVDYRNGRIISLDFSQGSGDLSDEDLSQLAAFKRLGRLNLSKMPITDAGLENINDLSGLTSLRLDDTKITDAGLAHIKRLTSLRYLHLNGTTITDEGLAHLVSLARLEWLGLDGTKITDAGLAHIESLTGLKHLRLGRTGVTDAGMIHLQPLMGLEWLDLNSTKVTDAGLEHLEGLDDLQDLVYYNSEITLEGTQRLKEKQPNLTAY
jgi:Leucine Rich Repeat (LRR) protein